jgi:UDP-N-acetylmuramate dehydrogenase
LYDLTASLSRIPHLELRWNAPLRELTRFGVGGAAALLADAHTEAALIETVRELRRAGVPMTVIGGGTNLVAADGGFAGAIVRYRAREVRVSDGGIAADAGAELQAVVDRSIEHGLAGLHTMTRIPGWTGAAIYGNAGAYGHSIHEFITQVRYFDGAEVRDLDNKECRFAYRESIFKRRKEWIILSAGLKAPAGDPEKLRREAAKIREIRDAKYPPEMKCAGSIFKNLLLADLPREIAERIPLEAVREGKVPSAWFLEQAGAKGMRRGGIQVAHYHANLILNDGGGAANDVRWIVERLKAEVKRRFGLTLEEEVQYIGFPEDT